MTFHKFAIIIMAIIIFSTLAQSVPEITINVDILFEEGDTIQFSYIIISDENETIQFVPKVNCPNQQQGLLIQEEVALKKGEPYLAQYFYGPVTESMDPGKCQAQISLADPYSFTESKDFFLKTQPTILLVLKTCLDEACVNQSSTFVEDSEIFLSYDSSDRAIVKSILTFPDKTVKALELPTSIKAEQVGVYQVKATAPREDFATVSRAVQFIVTEKVICIIDGECKDEETIENCPSDCFPIIEEPEPEPTPEPTGEENVETQEGGGELNLILALILVIILFVAIYFVMKRAFF